MAAAMQPKPVLSFFERIPPYSIVAAADMAGVELELKPDPLATKDTVVTLKFNSGEVLTGAVMILRYIARAAGPAAAALYGATPLDACRIDQWMEFSASQFVSGPGLEAAVAAASAALALHTYMAGAVLTIADLAAWGALQSAPMWVKVRRTEASGNLTRWFEWCAAQPALAAAVDALDPKAQKARAMGQDAKAAAGPKDTAGRTGSFDIDLPDARVGAVVTRFPPEPSGYLHIGHAKAALLNQYFADQYSGKLLVRFDDTNPSKESTEFVSSIVDDMARLGLRYQEPITYTSDYFDEMIAMARALIDAGHLYADDTDVDTMRDERLRSIESKRRGMPPPEVHHAFDEMLLGSPEGAAFCLRVRMDMAADNACLRDPVAYRCNDHPHWRTGTKHKCYPTYDFACPYVDAAQGVTHALRTSEYRDREEQFHRILAMMRAAAPRLPHVHIWDYSRLNFVHTVLSKRKLQRLVDLGVVNGWTDPRFPTVQGILRRGMSLDALREFILSQGASKNTTLQEWDKIWTINKKIIDPIAPRHTAVVTAGRVAVTLSGGPPELELATVAKHKKNAAVGSKTLYKTSRVWVEQVDARAMTEGEEVTLMDWGNAIVRRIHSDDASGAVTAIDAQLHLEGDFKKTKLKVTWLADVPDCAPLRIVELGHLITKAKVEEDDDFDALVNRESWKEEAALGDPNMRALQAGDIIQLERKGFFRVDEAATRPGKPLLLFSVPDGRQKK